MKTLIGSIVICLWAISSLQSATLIGNVLGNGTGDGEIRDFNASGLQLGGLTATVLGVADRSATDDEVRVIYKFELPTISGGETFQSAQLNYNLTNFFGTPFSDLDIIYFEPTATTVETSDYNDVTNAVTFASVLTPGSSTGAKTLSGSSLDTAIADAYTASRTHVAFRFQYQNFAPGNANNNEYRLRGYEFDNGASTFLQITTTPIPEPSTFALVLLSSVALIWLRRNRPNY
ncbi:MAG: PEP-CTERM sorting domain-containing protein [Verrucomicrobiota bacterium]